MLELVQVTKSYPLPGEAGSVCVLKNLSLEITEGRTLAIVGPSGCGKSTLLNIMGALDRPCSGRVVLDGRDLTALDEAGLAKIRNQEIGFVFQLHHLLPQCTVLENVLVPTLVERKGPPKEAIEKRALDLLSRVGLREWAQYRPGELSGGQRQRVAVVRALMNKPRLFLADEPTGSLDEKTSESLVDLLVELNRTEGITLVMVTHSSPMASRMERVLTLHEGILQEDGSRA